MHAKIIDYDAKQQRLYEFQAPLEKENTINAYQTEKDNYSWEKCLFKLISNHSKHWTIQSLGQNLLKAPSVFVFSMNLYTDIIVNSMTGYSVYEIRCLLISELHSWKT